MVSSVRIATRQAGHQFSLVKQRRLEPSLRKLFDEERCYPKKNAVKWLRNCERPSSSELKRSMLPKPARFEGSTFETDISNIRVTGDAQFIETIAGLLKPILDLENDETRVELNLQRTKIRDTKRYTGNYALYLSVTERGGQ